MAVFFPILAGTLFYFEEDEEYPECFTEWKYFIVFLSIGSDNDCFRRFNEN